MSEHDEDDEDGHENHAGHEEHLDVGDLGAVIERGPCVICGEPGVQSFFASEPFIQREVRHEDGTVETIQEVVPAVHVCRAHFAEVFSERQPIGYCDAPQCRRWGPMGEPSPCGAPYGELPGAGLSDG